MTSQYAIVCSTQAVYVWQYQLPTAAPLLPLLAPPTAAATGGAAATSDGSSEKKKEGIERVFHIDDPASSASVCVCVFPTQQTNKHTSKKIRVDSSVGSGLRWIKCFFCFFVFVFVCLYVHQF